MAIQTKCCFMIETEFPSEVMLNQILGVGNSHANGLLIWVNLRLLLSPPDHSIGSLFQNFHSLKTLFFPEITNFGKIYIFKAQNVGNGQFLSVNFV